MNELLIEYKIKEHYLKKLEEKDFINKFQIFTKDLSENKTHVNIPALNSRDYMENIFANSP